MLSVLLAMNNRGITNSINDNIKVLNLYAGLGGNRQLWSGVDVTAVEMDEKIANVYSRNNPDDTVIIGDAHKYLLENYQDFDFIWSSPPLSDSQ